MAKTEEAPKRTRKAWAPESEAQGQLVDGCNRLTKAAKSGNVLAMQRAMQEVATSYKTLIAELVGQ